MDPYQELCDICAGRTELDQTRLARELAQLEEYGLVEQFHELYTEGRTGAENRVNSLVAYALNITSAPPEDEFRPHLHYVNARVSMPDIDIDFPDDRRHEMIEYTVRQYGADRCAAIITFGTLGARAAVRDVGRTLEVPLAEVDRIARMVPSVPGKPVRLNNLLFDDATADEWPTEAAEIRAAYKADPIVQTLIDTAITLEGQTRHASTHAAGVVIADKPIVEYAPLHRPTKGNDSGPIQQVVQFDMNIVESIGLLKVDFLGLATLSIMRRACEHIEQRHGRRLDLSSIPYERCPEDPALDADILAAYRLMQDGYTVGVFQVEGAGLKRTLQEMKPDQFEHIIAAISLYRPGPMEYIPSYIRRMHGDEKITYHHPLLSNILDTTYGILVYQEQIMRVASDLGGYTPGEADLMRRAVSKKKAKDIEYHKNIFVEGAGKRGIERGTAEKIYGDVEFFARYGFNKSHAADYAVITVQTAYLKAHYPVEYLCALLEVEFDDTAKVPVFLAECRRLGIDVLPPDLNASGPKFTIEPNPARADLPESDYRRWAIRVGMGAIKNVGLGAVEAVVAEREANGLFATLDDFCERVDLRGINRRVLECMARVGCFDELVRPVAPHAPREVVLAVLDRMVGISGQTHEAASVGQLSMFDGLAGGGAGSAVRSSVLRPLPDVGQVLPKQRLEAEKELLGLYLSDHPLQQIRKEVNGQITHYCSEIGPDEVGRGVVIAGLLVSVRPLTTKKGDRMAFLKLEDLQGEIEVVVFPRTFEAARDLLQTDNILLVRGKVEQRTESLSVLADNIQLFEAKPITFGPMVVNEVGGYEAGPPEPPPPAHELASSLLDAMQHRLTLTLRRSDDEPGDLQRLRTVLAALREHPGTDRVELRCVLPNGAVAQLRFAELTTRWSAGLRDVLLQQGVEWQADDETPDPKARFRRERVGV